MKNVIELALNTADGVADCRLDPTDERGDAYEATILYPGMANGYSRSEIFCYTFRRNANSNEYFFDEQELHPKVRKLEQLLSAALAEATVQARG